MRLLSLILSLALLGCSSAPQEIKNPSTTIEEVKLEIDWRPFNDNLIKTSLALNKPIFLYLKDHRCGHCKKMQETTLVDPIIVRLINEKFVATQLDIKANPPLTRLFYQDDTIFVPKVIFIQQNSQGRFAIAEATGYMDSFEMLAVIEKAERFLKSKLNEANEDKKGSGKH